MREQGTMSRRGFFATGIAGAAGWATLGAARLGASESPGPQREYGWFPMGIQSYCLRKFSLDDTIAKVRGMGLHHIEFFGAHVPLTLSPADLAEVKKKCRRNEIAISGLYVGGFPPEEAASRKVFEFANDLGVRNLIGDPSPEALGTLEKLVDEFGIRVAIHNHGPGSRYDKIADVAKAFEGRHRWIGACVDSGHFIRSGEDPAAAVRAFEGRLFGVHVKDFTAAKKDAREAILGQGLLKLGEFLRAVRGAGFPGDGSFVLEYEENPEDPIADIEKGLAAVRATFA